jgi:PPOX class probable F420-dependent enzyme
LIGRRCSLLFAALQAITHPFAHARFLLQKRPKEQSILAERTMESSRAESYGFPECGVPGDYNLFMPQAIPAAISGQKYISLTTFRKNGVGVATPVWFGEDADKLYVMTRSDMGKTKRIRNNPQVQVAPCTIRGKVTGPEFAAAARILSPPDHPHARETINRKYWMAKLPLVWWRTDTYLELTFS